MPTPTRSVSLEELFERSSWIRGLARRLVSDEARVDDLVQEVWVAALSTRGLSGSLEAWVRGVLRNVVSSGSRNDKRRRGREQRSARDEATPSSAELVEQADLQRVVVGRLDRLPQIYREVLILRYYEGLPPRRIAAHLRVPVATVRTRTARALDLLREELDREHSSRREWCLALVPLAAGRRAALVVGSGTVAASLLKLAVLLLAGLGGLLAWRARPWAAVGESTPPLQLAGASDVPDSASVPAAPEASTPAAGSGRVPLQPASSRPSAALAQRATLRTLVRSSVDGRPIANVRLDVRFRDLADARHGDSVFDQAEEPATDAAGRAVLEVPSGVQLAVSASGYGVGAGNGGLELGALRPEEVREIVLELPTGFDTTFHGRLVDGDDRPIAHHRARVLNGGATYGLDETPWLPGELYVTQAETWTDEAGAFVLEVASWDDPLGWVEHASLAPRLFAITHGHEQPERPFVVRLQPPASLVGTLVDASGRVLAGAEVRLSAQRGGWRRPEAPVLADGYVDFQRRAVTDSVGGFVFEGLPTGVPLQPEIALAGDPATHDRRRASLRLEPGETRAVRLVVGGQATLAGRALDSEGRPVPDLPIWLVDPPGYLSRTLRGEHPFAVTRTDAQGGFKFEGVASGSWWVGPAPDTSGPLPAAPLVTLVEVFEQARRVEVTLEVQRGSFLRGRVVGPDGAGVPRAGVSAHLGSLYAAASSDASGAFEIGPVEPGTYRVEAHGLNGSLLASAGEVSVHTDAEPVDVPVQLGGRLRGRVLDSASGLPGVADVRLALLGSELWWSVPAARGNPGSFERSGLPAGTYEVIAQSAAGTWGRLDGVRLAAGETVDDLLVYLSPGGRLTLRAGSAHAGHGLRILRDGRVLAEAACHAGHSVTLGLPPGPATLVDWPWGEDAPRESSRAIDITPGATLEIEVP